MSLDVLELIIHDRLKLCWGTNVLAEKARVVLECLRFNFPYNIPAFGDVLLQLMTGLKPSLERQASKKGLVYLHVGINRA